MLLKEPRPHSGSQLRALRLDAGALDAADVAAWSELADRAVEPNPFFRPEYVLASVVERREPVELIVVRDHDRWLACMPFRRKSRWRGRPFPCLHPWLPEYSVLATPLVDRHAVGLAADAFVAKIREQRDAAMLVLEQFPPDGPVAAALAAASQRQGVRPIVVREFERAAWRRRPDGSRTNLPVAMGADRQARKLRQLARRLDAELEVVDRASEPAAWDRFMEMESSGWKGKAGTALLAKSTDAAFFRAMCAGMSRRGALELRSLEGDGRSVAMECNLKEGDEFLYAFKMAYDAEFDNCSPGAQLQLLWRPRAGLLLFDRCAPPDNITANQIWPDRRRMQTLLLPTGAPSARLLRLGLSFEATRLGLWSTAKVRSVSDEIRRRRAG